ncbi:MAG: AraC family transcriptional regulator [Bacteroidales bacterium]|jgi:AraC-like DNA-binding protein|nr:AraC family transcriptional regulator [Bacteroidales bacterium]
MIQDTSLLNLVIYYIAIVQALFTGIVFISKKGKASSSALLTGIVILMIFDIAIGLIKLRFPDLFGDTLPLNFFVFAYGPMILLYLRATLLKIRTLAAANIIHFIPFLLFLCLSLVLRGDTAIFRVQFFRDLETQKALYIVYYSLTYVSVIVYTIASFACIGYAKKNIEDLYSFELSEKLLYWFKYLTMLFFIMYILQAVTGFSSIITGNDTFDTNMFVVVGQCVFFLSLQYFLINRPELFIDEKNSIYDFSGGKQLDNYYNKSKIPKDTLDQCAEKLVKLMEEKKIYLKNDLNLQDVSEMINYPKHYITQALNLILKKNFYLFVNEYRVNEFKARVADKKNNNLTIMSIAYDSGFNSKSTFNSIFKKFTGQTPSEYVNLIRANNHKK